MTPETVMDLAHRTLTVTSMIAAPMLLIALVAGLLIGMLQAATQINESTLSFIMQSTRELIEELMDSIPFNGVTGEKIAGKVICVPARDEADEIVGLLLSESLQRTVCVAKLCQ